MNKVNTNWFRDGSELDLGGLLAIHDSAACLLRAHSEAVAAYRSTLEIAEGVWALAESHLQVVRRQIRERYVDLGLEVPPLFHKSACRCDACVPIPGPGDEEHG